jgi:hypothetical protein
MKTARLCSVIFIALALVLSVGPARAVPYILSNNNSTITIDPASQSGAYGWIVDGSSVLYQQWFWYRIGDTGGEQSINTLTLDSAVEYGTKYLDLTYGGVSGGNAFTIEVDYGLTGGTAGSHTSDVGETIKINNTGTDPLDFHFFQYSDFDLSSPNMDSVNIDPDLQLVKQTPGSGGSMMSEAVITSAPQHGEANYYYSSSSTLTKLDDSSPTTLDGVLSAGPGDVTWAFEWDQTIAAGGSYIISKDKNIAPSVPEPATILGLGTILLLVGRKLSRRQA